MYGAEDYAYMEVFLLFYVTPLGFVVGYYGTNQFIFSCIARVASLEISYNAEKSDPRNMIFVFTFYPLKAPWSNHNWI